MSSLLSITDLTVSVEKKEIVRGFSLTIEEGEVHAIMGPNGSGKSTLVNTLMGHPKYMVTKGKVTFKGKNLLTMKPDERARAGLFLAFQYPRELAGVSLRSFLFAAYKMCHAEEASKTPSRSISPIKFKKLIEEKMLTLKMDPAFSERSVNQGWSGGEKKKAEILQLKVLSPALALLDETDSGLDIDALKTVAEGIESMRSVTLSSVEGSSPFSALIVTHYARILDYIAPDKVHVMVGGKIVESGGAELAKKLEKEGYAKYGVKESPVRIVIG